MQQDLQYYLNHRRGLCILIPSKNSDYLLKEEYLGEYVEDEEKELVLRNLGISDKLDKLKTLIDNKVIQAESVPWDLNPTQGHTDHVLSSDALYNLFENYYIKQLVDSQLDYLWGQLLNIVDEKLSKFQVVIDNYDFLLQALTTLEEIKLQYQTLREEFDSYIQSTSGAVVYKDFGNNDYVGVSLKAITDALDMVWKKIEDITGEALTGINMIVSPNHFVGEDSCNVHVVASTVETNGVFEHITVYVNDEPVIEKENVQYIDESVEITDTSIIKCEAQILGRNYTRQATIQRYSSFWLGAGNNAGDVISDVSNLRSITNNMRGSYDIHINDGEHIIVIVGDRLKTDFIRADMNGFEIPFDVEELIIEENSYVVYTSKNTYLEGTYNIDING